MFAVIILVVQREKERHREVKQYVQAHTWLVSGRNGIQKGSNGKVHNHCTAAAAAKSLQSCPTLCDPRDGRPPGSSVPGILQARVLEWVAIAFSITIALNYLKCHCIFQVVI